MLLGQLHTMVRRKVTLIVEPVDQYGNAASSIGPTHQLQLEFVPIGGKGAASAAVFTHSAKEKVNKKTNAKVG